MADRKPKAFAYITHGNRLLVFRHVHHPDSQSAAVGRQWVWVNIVPGCWHGATSEQLTTGDRRL
jgi:hypothetical protein